MPHTPDQPDLFALGEASPIPLLVSKASDGEILYANDSVASLVGLSADKLIGRHSPEFYADTEDRQILVDALSRDGRIANHEMRLKSDDGRVFWVMTTLVLSQLGDEQVIFGGIYDIDDRRKAEEALRESEALFRQLTDNINEVFWMRDLESGKVIYCSPAFERIYGIPRETVIAHPDAILSAVHPEDLPGFAETMKHALETMEIPPEAEFRIVRPDGTVRWMRTRVFPIANGEGRIYRVCGVSEDFTERKEAEASLEQERSFVSAILDTAGALVVVLDPAGHIVRWNRACETLTDYRFSEVQDRPFWSVLLLPSEVNRIREVFAELAAGSFPNQTENHWVTRSGEHRLISWSNTALTTDEGRVTHVVATGIDVTDHRAADEALRQSEERFRNIVENANDIIYSLQTDGVFTYVSPNWTTILGHDVDEVVGRSFELFVHADDLDVCLQFLQTVIKTGGRQSGVEYRVRHKDGRWRWHTSNASAMTDDDGNVTAFIGIARDITEKVESAQELERTNEELRTAQTQLVQSEKMAALGNLVAGIAHEINTPVGAITSVQDTMLRGAERMRNAIEAAFPDDNETRDRLIKTLSIVDDANGVIATATERVTSIVRSLRNFARLDEAEMNRVDLHEGIDNSLTLVHHDLKNRVEVVKDYGDIPEIVCWPSRLNQVFLNILVNAGQAIEGEGQIRIRTRLENDRVHIAFSDSGKGIASENLSKVFDPGFTTKGVGVGTGLGLSICYQIAQDHQGEIRAVSEVGKGTTFTVVLPTDLEETPKGVAP